ncbi:hypothetical protein CTI12_AA505190 [Artemisia annua]|uniref:Zinc finger GRF-type domain-containing protein n=1 Tax=Artemisia annua TaxID=35608 RepID=A0A2U1LD45_ARTAN|nr:hypothetical protein CTI12_AA505190 [Artemisia annua]
MSTSSSSSNQYYGNFPRLCKCKNPLPLVLRKSTTLNHPARRFLCCPNPSWSGNQCKAYYFVDDELPSDYYKYEMYNLMQKAGIQKQENQQAENTQMQEIGHELHLLKTELSNMEKEFKECRENVLFYKRVVMVMLLFIIVYLLK